MEKMKKEKKNIKFLLILIWKESNWNEFKSIQFQLSSKLIENIWISITFRIWSANTSDRAASCWKCVLFEIFEWTTPSPVISANLHSKSKFFNMLLISSLSFIDERIFARNYWSGLKINKPKWFVFYFLCSAGIGIKCDKPLNALFYCVLFLFLEIYLKI